MNDATFLLEHHVLQPERATTPLRQLYFIVQMMLIEPTKAEAARCMFEQFSTKLKSSFENAAVLGGLDRIVQLVAAGRAFDALKTIRVLFPIEEEILSVKVSPSEAHAREVEAR